MKKKSRNTRKQIVDSSSEESDTESDKENEMEQKSDDIEPKKEIKMKEIKGETTSETQYNSNHNTNYMEPPIAQHPNTISCHQQINQINQNQMNHMNQINNHQHHNYLNTFNVSPNNYTSYNIHRSASPPFIDDLYIGGSFPFRSPELGSTAFYENDSPMMPVDIDR